MTIQVPLGSLALDRPCTPTCALAPPPAQRHTAAMTATLRAVASRAGLLVALAACAAPTPRAAPPPSPTADAAWSPTGAHAFARGVISSGDAIAPSFAPDGRTIYFVKTGRTRTRTRLMTARLDRGAWTAPAPAPFGDDAATELSPFVAPDGAIYFASTRPRAPPRLAQRSRPVGRAPHADRLRPAAAPRRSDRQPRRRGRPVGHPRRHPVLHLRSYRSARHLSRRPP
jgi:hypothetical protein